MAKRLIQQVTTNFDLEGNTQTRETVIVRKVEPEKDFVKLYLEDIARLKKLTLKEREVLDQILCRMDYENKVALATGTRIEICQAVGIFRTETEKDTAQAPEPREVSLNSFGVILNRLTKSEVIYRKGKGVYLVNPYLFGKGRWTDIEKIRLTISYLPGAEPRQLQTEVQRPQERPLGDLSEII
jgi:hypothetical protein